MKKLAIGFCVAITAFCLLASTEAATKKPTTTDKNKQKQPTPTLVESVNVGAGTITTKEGGIMQVYTFDTLTVVMVNGQRSTIDQVKAGMKVDLVVGTGGKKVSRIEAMTIASKATSTTTAKKKK